jgi:hypothetical protein
LSTTLSKIWLSVGPLFTVLSITPSFLVRFLPVKYRIKALDVLYPMVKWWSTKFSFWSGQHLGQTSIKFGQPWSNLVKVGQTSPNSGKCVPGLRPEVLSVWWVPVGSDRLGQTSVKLGQTWLTLVKFGQPWSSLVRLREMRPRLRFEVI